MIEVVKRMTKRKLLTILFVIWSFGLLLGFVFIRVSHAGRELISERLIDQRDIRARIAVYSVSDLTHEVEIWVGDSGSLKRVMLVQFIPDVLLESTVKKAERIVDKLFSDYNIDTIISGSDVIHLEEEGEQHGKESNKDN